ncbi:MAG: hypothetical protein GEV04_02305 [Actinophytocola sp.]|nr:hypothetical protein [Actinophytocola sp.]
MFGTASGSALWTALQPGGNPLIRPTDRRQARLAAVLIGLALLAGPIIGGFGFSYHASLTDRATAQRHDRSPVDAVLLEDAPVPAPAGAAAVRMPRTAAARAEWSTPDGLRREGKVPVTSGSNAGDTVTIWVDRDGNRTAAPLSSGETAAASVFATLGIWLVFVAALAGYYVLMRVRLDHARYAAWEREWQELDEHRT